jgi:hypothetical protein
MGEYVKKLIEVDVKAVELANKRQTEIESLEISFNSEMEKYKEGLQKATEAGAQIRKEILDSAVIDMEKIKKESLIKLQKAEKYFESVKTKITEEIWHNILK